MELLWVGIFILLAGFFSGSETAFISINRLRLHANLAAKDRRSRILEWLMQRPEDMIGMFLLGTNTCIVAASLIFTNYVANHFKTAEFIPLIVTGILTPLILLFSDVFPKIIFRTFSDQIMRGLAWIYWLMFILLFPFQFLFVRSIKLLLRLLGMNKKNKGAVSRDDFKLLLDISISKGVMKDREKDFIESIMNFKNIKAREIMIPLIRMVCVEENDSVSKASQLMLTRRHSRLPVYRGRVDNIVGYIENKDILNARRNEMVKQYTRDTLFLPECLEIDKLLLEMQESMSQMIFTVDEYGGVSGVITSQDLVTEIVGEFVDLGSDQPFKKEGDSFVVDGLFDIDELEEELHIDIKKDSFETVSGFVLQQLEHLPHAGEKFNYSRYEFEVLSIVNRRIEKVRISTRKRTGTNGKKGKKSNGKNTTSNQPTA